MKVAKALKEKNRLAGEIAKLKALIASQNVRRDGQEFDYDNHELLATLRERLDELVALKTRLAMANVAIYDAVFRLAELKGLAAAMKGIDVKAGQYVEGQRFGEEAVTVNYRAQLGRREIDGMVTELEAEMAMLQDRLDEFNASAALPA